LAARRKPELPLNLLAQAMHLPADTFIHRLQSLLHCPQRRVVRALQLLHFPLETRPHPGIMMIFVPLPALQYRLADAINAGSIALEVTPESPIQVSLRVVSRNRCMLEVEFVLPVDICQVDLEHTALVDHLPE